MKIIIQIIVLVLSFLFANAQDSIRIQGHFKNNSKFAKVVVKKFNVGSFDIAAVPITNAFFKITAPSDLEPGVYRFQYSQANLDYVDIIIDGKEREIAFEIDCNVPENLPVFSKSNENINWYGFQKQQAHQLSKIEILHQMLAQYPTTTDEIFLQTQNATKREIQNYQVFFQSFIKQNNNNWAGKLAACNVYYFTNPKDHITLQENHKREHFWDGIDCTNPNLINTPIYTQKILDYLRYYIDNTIIPYTEEERDAGFIKSVDIIIKKFSGNETTKEFAIKYLQLGFKEIGNEKVLQYIDQKYQHIIEQCNDNTTEKSEFEKRMAGYQAMKIGSQAPEININITNGKTTALKDIKTTNVILVFWASWCPNCEQQLPELQNYIKDKSNITVVAVSLDDDKAKYEEAIKKYPNMLHVCDYKKWEGKYVNDYYIYGSPTYILLDKERKIMGKFSSLIELQKALK